MVGNLWTTMESTRQTILEQASRLAIAHGEVPSLNALAAAAGLSKGGLMHHFPTRDALLMALASDGIALVDGALQQASLEGKVLQTWLKLSIPEKNDRAFFQAMASLFFAGKSDQRAIQKLAKEANKRWEALLATELGGAEEARVAQLLGDGLLFGSITGTIKSKNAAIHLKSAQSAIAALIAANR